MTVTNNPDETLSPVETGTTIGKPDLSLEILANRSKIELSPADTIRAQAVEVATEQQAREQKELRVRQERAQHETAARRGGAVDYLRLTNPQEFARQEAENVMELREKGNEVSNETADRGGFFSDSADIRQGKAQYGHGTGTVDLTEPIRTAGDYGRVMVGSYYDLSQRSGQKTDESIKAVRAGEYGSENPLWRPHHYDWRTPEGKEGEVARLEGLKEERNDRNARVLVARLEGFADAALANKDILTAIDSIDKAGTIRKAENLRAIHTLIDELSKSDNTEDHMLHNRAVGELHSISRRIAVEQGDPNADLHMKPVE